MSTYTFNIRNLDMNWWSNYTLHSYTTRSNTAAWQAYGEAAPYIYTTTWFGTIAWDFFSDPTFTSIIQYPPTHIDQFFELRFGNSSVGNSTSKPLVIRGPSGGSQLDTIWTINGWDMSSTITLTNQLVTFFGANFNANFTYPTGTNFNLIIFRGTIPGDSDSSSAAFSYLGNDPNYDSQSTYTF
jgi:hypothetical protein